MELLTETEVRQCKFCKCDVEVEKKDAKLIDAGTMMCTCEKINCIEFGHATLQWPLGFKDR